MALTKIKLKQIESGSVLALKQDVVSISGSDSIGGSKTFNGSADFLNSVNYYNSSLTFNNSNFVFDNTSLNNLTGAISSKFITVDGTQSISGIKTFINGLKVGGNGGSGVLYSGQINPVYVSGVSSNSDRYLIFVDSATTGFKNIQLQSGLSYNPYTNVLTASTFKGGVSGNSITAASSTALNISAYSSSDSVSINFPSNTPNYTFTTGYFGPAGTTATKNLGSSSVRWKEVFAGVGAINTSDRNLKTEISEIPDSWLDAWEQVNYVRYKFKDAVAQKGLDMARWHVGHIAQDIYEVFNRHGLNALDMGLLCYDNWEQNVDQNGNIIASGEIWSIRADECQFMELALMRRSINRLKSGIII